MVKREVAEEKCKKVAEKGNGFLVMHLTPERSKCCTQLVLIVIWQKGVWVMTALNINAPPLLKKIPVA